MPSAQEALERLKEEGVDQELLDALDGSQLREENRTLAKEVERLKPFEGRLQSLEKAPTREEAFRKAGVDFDALRPAEKRALEGFDWEGDAPDPDKVSAFVSEYELPTASAESESEERTQADGMVEAATSPVTPIPADKRSEFEAARDGAKTKEELTQVLAAHGQLDTD